MIGLPEPPPWPGDLADGTGDEGHVARRRAAVLAAAAAMARATVVMPASPAEGAALARAAAEAAARGEAGPVVVEIRPWGAEEIEAALAAALEPPEDRPAWAEALAAATGGWPGAVIAAIEACARAGLLVDALEEWASTRHSEPGPRARSR